MLFQLPRTHTLTHAHAHTHTHTHTRIDTCTYRRTHTCTHTYVCMHTYKYAHIRILSHTHTYIYIYIYCFALFFYLSLIVKHFNSRLKLTVDHKLSWAAGLLTHNVINAVQILYKHLHIELHLSSRWTVRIRLTWTNCWPCEDIYGS